MSRTSTVHFYGGAGSVTGSNFLLESEGFRTLIDCGLFQGCDFCDDANWKPFPYDPASIPTLVVTHAHIDHVGRIPLLVKRGFRGKIISTVATRAIAEPLLLDSMEILTEEARRRGSEPLYTEGDIAAAMKLWETTSYRTPMNLSDGFMLEFLDSGHILGAAMAKFTREGKNIIFTGDLGGDSLLLPPRDSIAGAQYLVMESVYGSRAHADAEPEVRREKLADIITETAKRDGEILIPAFSTERTQDILFELRALLEAHAVPSVPVYVDSPLALEVTRAFLANPDYFKKDIAMRIRGGEDIFAFPDLHFVKDAGESRRIASSANPKIIIAGSGMSNGGRVRAHEREVLPKKNATLLIVGYQAAGSLGRRLIEGAKSVEIGGAVVPVRCHIEQNLGYSAHLDGPHLLEFAGEAAGTLKHAFVVMGEPASASFLVQRMRDRLGIEATAPEEGDQTIIEV